MSRRILVQEAACAGLAYFTVDKSHSLMASKDKHIYDWHVLA